MIESTRDAAVTPADVFRLFADPSTWSAWGHNAMWARAEGQLVEGGIVEVRANYGKVYPCRITRLISDRLLELEARPPMMRVPPDIRGRADTDRIPRPARTRGVGAVRRRNAPARGRVDVSAAT